MSVSKPFVFALVCDVGRRGGGSPQARRERHRPAVQLAARRSSGARDGRTNPMVNPGAIATTSLVPGASADEKWTFILEGLSRFAGRTLALDEEVYASASATNHLNRDRAPCSERTGGSTGDPAEAVDLYTRQCSLACEREGSGRHGRDAGRRRGESRHERAGGRCRDLPLRVGRDDDRRPLRDLGRLALRHRAAGKERHRRRHRHRAPGKGGLGTFAPLLDAAGNSVKGQLAAKFLSSTWEWISSRRNPKSELARTGLARLGLLGLLAVVPRSAFPPSRAPIWPTRPRSPSATRRSCASSRKRRSAGTARGTAPSTSISSSTSRAWRCAGPGTSPTS